MINVRELKGLALAFVLGYLLTYAFAPWHCFPMLYATIPVWLWLLEKHPKFSSWVLLSLAFGSGYALHNFYWLLHAFAVRGTTMMLFGPLALVILAVVLSLPFVGAAIFAHALRLWLAWPLALVSAWSVLTYLRMQLMPWSALGYAWFSSDYLAQLAAYVGIVGMNLLVMLSPALLYMGVRHTEILRRRLLLSLAAFIPLLGLVVGYTRLHDLSKYRLLTTTPVLLLHSAMQEKEKWDLSLLRRHADKMTALSRGAAVVVWPEAALPIALDSYAAWRQRLLEDMPDNTTWLVGTLRFHGKRITNSFVRYSRTGESIYTYDKHHLTPFGEYLPFISFQKLERRYLIVGRILRAAGIEGFLTPGTGPILPLWVGNTQLVPSICYEISFPSPVLRHTDAIVHVTNDAWFGTAVEVAQHFDYLRARAVEYGVGVITSSNRGPTSIVLANGAIATRARSIETWEGVRGHIPAGLWRYTKVPLYRRLGPLPFFSLVFFVFLLSFLWRERGTNQPDKKILYKKGKRPYGSMHHAVDNSRRDTAHQRKNWFKHSSVSSRTSKNTEGAG